MNVLVTLLTICAVVFLYLHVVFHLKTSNDLEIYDLELPNKNKLEEVCNLRQPLLFDFWNDDLMKCTPAHFKHDAFDLNVVDPSNVAVPLCAGKAIALFSKSPHYTENNFEFLQETLLVRSYEKNDFLFRPPMVVQIRYDLIFGGENATTKLKYSDSYRNYFLATAGEVSVKLAPPRNNRYLYVKKDYETEEFYSETDAWTDATDKVKYLDLTLKKGQMLYIPAYWFYSFKIGKEGCLCSFHYKTVMNIVATLPDILVGILQRQNTKTVIAHTTEQT
jgi:hypothetical protein